MKVFLCVSLATLLLLSHNQDAFCFDNNGIEENPSEPIHEKTTCTEQFEPYAGECNKFYICDHGRPIAQSCPSDLHWNDAAKTCDWPKNANCAPTKMNSLERKTTCSEPFEPFPGDCNKFYVCDNDRPIVLSCPAQLHWNNKARVCDWPQNANCGSNTPPKTEPQKPVIPESKVPETSAITKPDKSAQLQESISKPTKPVEPIKPMKPMKPVDPVDSASAEKVNPINPTDSVNPSRDDDFKVVCYFTNWAWYRPDTGKYTPENIDESLCTHIIYAFSVLDPNTLTIKIHDSWADIDNKFYEKVTAYRKKGIKVLIAIGGWNDSLGDKYGRLLLNGKARQNFILNAMEFVQLHNFDGLDLDLEYPACWQNNCEAARSNEKEGFAQFAKELSEAFKSEGLLVSAAVSASQKVIDAAYDVPKLANCLDWISIMSYDYHGSFDGKTGHNAPLYATDGSDNFNANYSTHYWMQSGAPAKKLVMGVPSYGQSFTLANVRNNGLNAQSSGPGEAGQFTRQGGMLSYYEICDKTKNNGFKVVRDLENRIGLYAFKSNQWVSFDDVENIRVKAKLMRDMKLGGGMIWALDLDDFTGKCGCGKYPLLTALNQELRAIGGANINNCT